MTPEEQFAALVALAQQIDPSAIPTEALDNYMLTLSGTSTTGVVVQLQPRGLSAG